MAQAWYATREDIRSALDSKDAARTDAQIDRALAGATRTVTEACQRDFAPVLDTKFFDWPSEQTPRSWRLWLDRYNLIAPTLIMSAGVEVPSTDYNLEPANEGPPYTYIETRLDRPSVWAGGSTWQHAIAITGWWGYTDDQAPAGALTTGIDATTTAVAVTDSTAVGVGNLIAVGAERMIVTGKRLADTGQTLQAPLTAKASDNLVQVQSGAAFHQDEVLTLGSERMRIRDITGNALIVERATDGGTTLAAHTAESIWAPRTLTVARAQAGTTAAAAAGGAGITRWVPPELVHNWGVAEAMHTLLQEQAGYLRTMTSGGSGGGKEATFDALKDLREQCVSAHGRQARMRAV